MAQQRIFKFIAAEDGKIQVGGYVLSVALISSLCPTDFILQILPQNILGLLISIYLFAIKDIFFTIVNC